MAVQDNTIITVGKLSEFLNNLVDNGYEDYVLVNGAVSVDETLVTVDDKIIIQVSIDNKNKKLRMLDYSNKETIESYNKAGFENA